SVGGVAATGTIQDNDTITVASVSTETEAEGTSLVHDVALSGAPASPLTIPFSLTNSTTVAADLGAITFSNGVVDNGDGTITIPTGVTAFTITVISMDDAIDELDEQYGLSVGGVAATGTIQDNDVCISNPVTDCDGDGVTNGDELSPPGGGIPTNPEDPCSYNVSDITLVITSTNDCDGDGVLDAVEIANGTNPKDPCFYNVADITVAITATSDCDGDGVTNATEIANGTNPKDPCSYNIVDITTTITAINDCDGDGVVDATEIANGTNPKDPCSYNISDITVPVTTTADCTAEIKVVKTADYFGTNLGDSINYTITVENTGNVRLTNISLVDSFTDAQGNVINLTTPVTFQSANLGSTAGTLLVGETATYIASFTITQQAINAGGVSNSVVASGIAPNGSSINDMSDDGDDLDGNSTDDPTVTQLGCLIVFNEFSPNDDGTNDTFVIGCIENYPNNKLEIYNRWGNIVYQKRGYNNEFNGTSNGRATMNVSEKLPVGTYYYILDLGDGSKPKVGWLYINR
ncbi:T9SS type B sorting domain-containing protein, partial [Mariniflexile maritimum]|uniref:T9SS type B sorting domain-containing protein n=1 Tax=Mariniflexile maritimum TaxID=2682493 RepID=UPI0012F62FA9